MAYYTVYVGGERRDRETTDEDRRNVQRALSIMDASRCYTVLRDSERTIGQAEHVLDALISVSYISSPADVEHIKTMLASAGVTACTVVTCADEECTVETGSAEVSLEQPAPQRVRIIEEEKIMRIYELKQAIANEKPRCAWGRGVKAYAEELAEELEDAIQGGYFAEDMLADRAALKAQLLNGAEDWSQYSYGGSALIYDGDIAERLCSPSAYKRAREGERRPNSREEWLDVQARALSQAANMIVRRAKKA